MTTLYQKNVLKNGFILLYIWVMYSKLKTVQNGIMCQNVQQKNLMYCGNKYWNVQKNIGEQQEVNTLYYKVMYWKVLVRPRLRGLVGAQGSRTLLRGHTLGIPL